MKQELVECCPMFERYYIWESEDIETWFIDIDRGDEDWTIEPVRYCPYCGTELKTKE